MVDIVDEYKKVNNNKKTSPKRRRYSEDSGDYVEIPDTPYRRSPDSFGEDLALLGGAAGLEGPARWSDAVSDPARDTKRRLVGDSKPRPPYEEEAPSFLRNLELIGRGAEALEEDTPPGWGDLVKNPAQERKRRSRKQKGKEKFQPSDLIRKKEEEHPVYKELKDLAGAGVGGLISGAGGVVSNLGNLGGALLRMEEPNAITKSGRRISSFGDSLAPADGDLADRMLYNLSKETPGYLGAGRLIKGATSSVGKAAQEAAKSGFGNALGEEQDDVGSAIDSFAQGAMQSLAAGALMSELAKAYRRSTR